MSDVDAKDDANNGVVYIVTRGEYSDYRIDAVFRERHRAEAHAADYGTVEEWPVGGEARGDGRRPWHVYFIPDRGTGELLRTATEQPCVSEPVSVYHPWGRSDLLALSGDVWARDEKHALKIASEKFASLKAEGGRLR